jgi:hypothetical protein
MHELPPVSRRRRYAASALASGSVATASGSPSVTPTFSASRSGGSGVA